MKYKINYCNLFKIGGNNEYIFNFNALSGSIIKTFNINFNPDEDINNDEILKKFSKKLYDEFYNNIISLLYEDNLIYEDNNNDEINKNKLLDFFDNIITQNKYTIDLTLVNLSFIYNDYNEDDDFITYNDNILSINYSNLKDKLYLNLKNYNDCIRIVRPLFKT